MVGKKCREKICKECGKEFGEEWSNRPLRIIKNGIKVWVCGHCWYYKDYRNRPGDRKKCTDHRTGNLKDHTKILGGNCEQLTSVWRGVKNLNIELDCFNTPIDHSIDNKLGIIQTRCKIYDSYNQHWTTGGLDRDWDKDFNNMIYYCINEYGRNIERIYIFPKSEIVKRTTISVYKNPSKGFWYEKYRVVDDEILRKVNEIWQEMSGNNGDRDLKS